jgi:predicted nucleotidyltransferase
MDLSRPYSAISPSLEGDVLVALAASAAHMTGRQVARMVRRGSQPAVNAALERLVAQGIVLREAAPPAYLYELNDTHVGYPAVKALANMRAELLHRLRLLTRKWRVKAAHVSMFGSAARADGGSDSDIDLFVVRPRNVSAEDKLWSRDLSDLDEAVIAWTGNRASIVEVGEESLPLLHDENPSVLAALRAEGIHLAGAELADILGFGEVR